ncbi:Uma2 family endonuclease [Dactylosporangium sp. NPDC051541]|uniref:Uma2 family endonuclease n=1 Tax=Dactylosporangium sp. NPDC051541 TaxID=3363977 RepID=UPI0037989516
MSIPVMGHIGPWNEEMYFSLGETNERIELYDGYLFLSPAPRKRHQRILSRLWAAVDGPAAAAGLVAFTAVDVRLSTDQILIPDLVVADTGEEGFVIDAAEVRLVAEVVSPVNPGADRIVKLRMYAAAGITHCLLVEQEPEEDLVALRLFRLDGRYYVEHAFAEVGEVLQIREPFVCDLPADTLLGQD